MGVTKFSAKRREPSRLHMEHELGRGRSRVWNKSRVRYVGDQWNDRISSVEYRC